MNDSSLSVEPCGEDLTLKANLKQLCQVWLDNALYSEEEAQSTYRECARALDALVNAGTLPQSIPSRERRASLAKWAEVFNEFRKDMKSFDVSKLEAEPTQRYRYAKPCYYLDPCPNCGDESEIDIVETTKTYEVGECCCCGAPFNRVYDDNTGKWSEWKEVT